MRIGHLVKWEKRTQNKANSKPIQTQFKPKTNPIQSQYKPKQTQSKYIAERPKMNVSKVLTKDYENKSHFAAKAKRTQFKPKQTQPAVSLPNLFQMQNYNKNALKSPLSTLFRKVSKFLRIYLHYIAYYDILPHINEDVALCS